MPSVQSSSRERPSDEPGSRHATVLTSAGRSSTNWRSGKMNPISRRSFIERGIQAAGLCGYVLRPSCVWADETGTAADLAAKAVAFLRPRQGADGSWSGDRKEPGITALVVTAMLRSGRVTPDDPAVAKGLAYLERFLGPKGGLSEAPHSVYSTSVALMAFQAANKGGRFDRVIKGGQDFLKATQWDEGEGKGRERPAVRRPGLWRGNSRPTSRTRRSSSKHCTTPACPPMTRHFKRPWCSYLGARTSRASSTTCRGGQGQRRRFRLHPDRGEQRDDGQGRQGRGKMQGGGDGDLRSSAGMTYAGLKSMIYAGLTQDDLGSRPPSNTSASIIRSTKTPDRASEASITTTRRSPRRWHSRQADADRRQGKEHNWRAELVAALAKRQEANGSWVNRDDRFMEGDPNIVTSFGLLAKGAGLDSGEVRGRSWK